MNPLDPLREYGWIAVFVLFLIDRVWPWFSNLFTTQTHQRSKIAAEQALAAIQSEAEQRQAEREARAEERTFRHQIDERQVRAYEKLVDAQQQMAQLQATTNERIQSMLNAQSTLSSFMVESVIAMRETVGLLHPEGKALGQAGGRRPAAPDVPLERKADL
jgi:hypothetical protein